MRGMSGAVPIYSVYDEDGSLAARGSSAYLADLFLTEQDVICKCANGKQKRLNRRYTIVRDEEETRNEITKRREMVKKLYQQGASVQQISQQMGYEKSTVYGYLRKMREKGEIE